MADERLKQFSQGFNRDLNKSVWDRLKGIISPGQTQQESPIPNPPNINQRKTSMNEPMSSPMQEDELRKKVFAQLALERLRNPGDQV